LALSVLILVHELGHFLVARKAGIWVEEFGFGLPPRIVAKKIGETVYSLNLLPFGGFVKLHGEADDESLSKPKQAFLNKSLKARFAVIVAGVIMNFLLAGLIFAGINTISGIPTYHEVGQVTVLNVEKDSPAEKSDLKPGDNIKSINKVQVKTTEEFIKIVEEKRGESVEIELLRNGESYSVFVTPRQKEAIEGDFFNKISATLKNFANDEGSIGVAITSKEAEIVYPPLWKRPLVGISYGFSEAVSWGKSIVVGIAKTFVGLAFGIAPKLVGPVGLLFLGTEVAKQGIIDLLNFFAVISVNLAIINILPLPALDGGRLLFLVIEGVIGKKVVPRVEAGIHTVGMAILLLLIFVITFNEVRILISAGSISGFLESVLR
ncbi:hypothetical protein A2115_02460, partial [Candidatus Woesebacteria bacterium GWA1_41_8]